MKRLFTLLFLLTALSAGAAELRIADATLAGDVPVKQLALRRALSDSKFRISFDRVSAEEALKRLREGKADIVLADVPDIPEKFEGKRHIYGVEATVFYVNVGNTLEGATREQLRHIFTEEKPQWKHYNFMDGEIERIGIKPGNPGDAQMQQQLGIPSDKIASKITRYATTPEIVLMVGGTPNALGFGLFLPTAPVRVKMLAVDKITPTLKSVSDGSYPLAVKRAALTTTSPSQEATDFLALFDKPEFRESVENAGMLFIGE